MWLFADREEAGRKLADRLVSYQGAAPVVLALPRGGLPVAAEVAAKLGAPLDVIVVRKLGVPYQPELGVGAVGEEGAVVLNAEVLRASGLGVRDVSAIETRERAEVERRALALRHGRPMTKLQGRTVIIVDDGIATGGTARAAIQVARAHGAAAVVLAVPVAPNDTVQQLRRDADAVIVLETPDLFLGVGQWYRDFRQVSESEARRLLETNNADGAGQTSVRQIDLPVDGVHLIGDLSVPFNARGLVVFAHGSGSSRQSPRNRTVARALEHHALGTLLFDLLTAREERDRANVFDVALLGQRLATVTAQVATEPDVHALPIGYFGASTGAAAALWAAARPSSPVQAIVSRGGRPDLAGSRLASVQAPTLLIVGGADPTVLALNERAATELRCPHQLTVIPGATHLFEEPGALDAVATEACQWFVHHLMPAARSIA
jgi:putative phosphoribosyl transferase